MCGLNAYLTSGAPQLLTVNISQQSLTWPVLSSLRVQQKKSLSSTTASHSGLRLCNCMTWLTSGYFHPVKRKRKSPKVLTKISDPSVLLNLLRLLIDQQSQKVCATIKGFVRRRAATKKGEELYLFGQKGGGSRGGAWQQEGGRRGGGGGDEEGGCLCTCVRVAPWETGRKQDLKLKQHPANPPPPPHPLLPHPRSVYAVFLLLSVESGKEMNQSEACVRTGRGVRRVSRVRATSFSLASAHLHTSHLPLTHTDFPFIHLFYSNRRSGNESLSDPVLMNENMITVTRLIASPISKYNRRLTQIYVMFVL